MVDIVIDRTFVDRETGLRWVVDYKSSGPLEGESPEAFCEREAQTYVEQLRAYRDAMVDWGEQPVRCALYFTSINHFLHLEELDT